MLASGLLNRYGTVREIIPLRRSATSTSRPSSAMGCAVTAQRVMLAMLVTIPLAIGGELFHMGPVFVFSCSALSCIPLSYWLGQSTGSLGDRLGPVSGGLLNATFGNATEFIISIMALNSGLLVVVRTSLWCR
jgi:Ca2+:H+ antiporter